MRNYIKVSYTPKKTPLEKHAERFMRDYPRGMYEPTKPASRKERTTLKQVRTPRPMGHKRDIKIK